MLGYFPVVYIVHPKQTTTAAIDWIDCVIRVDPRATPEMQAEGIIRCVACLNARRASALAVAAA